MCASADFRFKFQTASTSLRAKRSNPEPNHGAEQMDCFVASAFRLRSASFGGRSRSLSYGGQAAPRNDGVIETCLRHLAARCPSCAGAFGPRKTEGAGKAGRPLHPQPRVRKLKAHERSHHRFTGTTRPSLRNGFNGLFRALPGDRAFLSPSPARLSADLTPASRRQDHTILPSAGPRPRQKRSPASTASRPASVTIAIRPSSGTRRRQL
jgi:hypothetical protein